MKLVSDLGWVKTNPDEQAMELFQEQCEMFLAAGGRWSWTDWCKAGAEEKAAMVRAGRKIILGLSDTNELQAVLEEAAAEIE